MLLPTSPILLSSLLLLASTSSAAIFNSKAVRQLSGKNFKQAVQGSDKLSIVAFVAPWCGHCQKLAPEFDKAAENLKGLVNIAAIDCDEAANKEFCGSQNIKGFPTIKAYPGGKAPSTAYEGARTAKGVVDYATSHMPTFVKRATSATEIEALRAKSATKPISLLFTSSAAITPLYKALSTDFHKTLDFYAARESKVGAEAMLAFGVSKTPALVILRGEEVEVYEGSLKYDALHAFLKPFAAKTQKPKASSKVKEEL